MSDEPKPVVRVPVDQVQAMERARQAMTMAELQLQAARLQYQLVTTTIERDHGFRFSPGTYIKPDGEVVLGQEQPVELSPRIASVTPQRGARPR